MCGASKCSLSWLHTSNFFLKIVSIPAGEKKYPNSITKFIWLKSFFLMRLEKVLSFTSKNPKLCCSLKLKNNARRAFCSIIWVYWISRVWNSRKWSKTPLPLGMDTEGLLFLLICTMRSSPHFVSSRGGKKSPQISVRRWLNTARYHLRVPVPSNTAVFGWIYSLEDTWIEEVISNFWRPFGGE